jgi:Domain of unknown function (DUF1707)
MARRSALRASDVDREQVAERLRDAAADGRLLAEELEHRLGTALSARTYGELDPLIADLPGWRIGRLRDARAPGLALITLVVTVLAAGVAVVVWRRW